MTKKKILTAMLKKTLACPGTQILLIGTVHKPISAKGDLKKVKKGFKQFASKVFFPLPQFGELKGIWQKYIEFKVENHNVMLDELNYQDRMEKMGQGGGRMDD